MSVTVRAYSEVDGQIAYASSVNRVIDDLYASINNLNSANLVNSAVGTNQVENGSITNGKLDASVYFAINQVFA